MFKFVSRSRSVKRGGLAHGPKSPDSPASLGEDFPVSSRQTSKQDPNGPQNEGFPSPPAVPSVGLSGNPGGSHLHPSSPPYPLPSPVPMMPERPRTSSGPGPNKSSATASFKDFDKRKSKDDLSLMTRGTARGGYKSYHIPIRGKPPSPSDNGGRDASPAPTIPVRTQTPESLPDNNAAIITIGMAIGSPTHPPFASYGSNWPPHTAIGVATSTPDPMPAPEPAAAQAPQRSKSTRWKLFGRSKSKRVKPEAAQASIPSGPSEVSVVASMQASSGLDRSNTERRVPKHKPLIVRSGTEPVVQSPADAARYDPRPPQSTRVAAKPVEVSAPTLGKSHGPLLDVEIPDITMERYSVMFGGLLQANGSSSSLLARRQATLERLRTINDRVVQEQETRDLARGRRATSPVPERSPSLSMFPTPPPTAPSPMSPRSRSATLPSGLPSNPRDGAQERKRQPQMQLEVSLNSSYGLPERKAKQGPSDSQSAAEYLRAQATPSQNSTFSPDQSSLILDSPTEERDQELHIKEQLRPTIYEPHWEMVSPSNSTKSQRNPRQPALGLAQTQPSGGTSSRSETSAAANPAQKHVKKTSEEEFDEAMLNAAVEISIARQISISQQQRDMLRKNIGGGVPAGARRLKVPRGERQGATSGTAGPAKPVATQNERLAATKTATPTLITPPEPFVGSPLAQHRKSERIVVEGA